MTTLLEAVRDRIGAGGPQLPSDQYHARIDTTIELLSPREMLELISDVLDDWGVSVGASAQNERHPSADAT